MFELQISDTKKDVMEVLSKKLGREVLACKGVFVFDEDFGRFRLSLAVADKLREYIWARAREEIVEILAVEYKYQFFSEKLEIPMLDDFLKTAFLSALAVFDKQTDKKYIEQHLFFDGEINLDSLFLFRLPLLKDRWSEIVELVESNFSELLPNHGMIEMMKFLIESSPVENNEVWVLSRHNCLMIANANRETMFEFENSKTGLLELVHRLVLLLPKKVVVSGKNLERVFEVFGKSAQQKIEVFDK